MKRFFSSFSEHTKRFIVFVCTTCILSANTPAIEYTVDTENTSKKRVHYQRIISLAPSLTEILFALSLDERIAGVTEYCLYPPAARQKINVGGYINPNYEMLLKVKPDLIVMLNEHGAHQENFKTLHLNYIALDNRNISGIMESIRILGEVCEVPAQANELLQDLQVRMDYIRRVTANRESPKVLVSVGRKMGSGSIKDAYIASNKTYFGDMITLAGGVNAFSANVSGFPMVTGEGIMRMNPDVIIDMVSNLDVGDINSVLAEWQVLSSVNAVKNKRIHVFVEEYADIPGPRFIKVLESMAQILHPDCKELQAYAD